jgi:hypothetical protein
VADELERMWRETLWNILSVHDRASLIDVLNENQRMQQW